MLLLFVSFTLGAMGGSSALVSGIGRLGKDGQALHGARRLLERVDSFLKNQRFIFGQQLADRGSRTLDVNQLDDGLPARYDLTGKINVGQDASEERCGHD